MKNFSVLNDSKFFTAGLAQCQDGEQVLTYLRNAGRVFIDALGQTVKPKIKAVFLSSTESVVRMGLYAQDQGRRPGRKRETPNIRKIGGLIVDEFIAPAHGLFECCLNLDANLPPLPVFSTHIRQIIRTDGKTWLALVREKETEPFIIAEKFTLPHFGHGLEWAMPKQGGALFDAPQDLYGFIEFLRRAMLDVDDKPDSAKRIASYGRELIYWLMAAEDAPRLERFVYEFCPNHGLHIGTLAPELQAAKILAYCIILDTVMAVISPSISEPQAVNASSYHEDWFSIAQCVGHDTPTTIVQTIAQKFRENREHLFPVFKENAPRYMSGMHDTGVLGFCRTLWEELNGDETGASAFSSKTQEMDRTWAGEILKAASGGLRRARARPTIVSIGSGVGNSAVKAVSAVLENAGSAILYAGDPDPVAIQTTRLRLAAFRFSLGGRGRTIVFHIVLDIPSISDSLPVSMHPIVVLVDCLTRFPSGAKATVDELSKRLDFAFELMEKCRQYVVSLRVPAGFLDGKEYAKTRRRLFDNDRELWVHYDETQERPKDKRLAQAFATILLDAVGMNLVSPPEQYIKVEARPELQFSLMPPRLSGGYLSWPALTDIAAVPPFNGPLERRGMTLIDSDAEALTARVREYLSHDISDADIKTQYPDMMKDAGRFKAELSRRKIREKTTFSPADLTPYPFRPFDERFAYLREMRPLFSDPAPDLQVIASIPGNWFLLASEGDAGIGDGVAAWASAHPCDYDYFAGRSRHFPVWIPDAILNGLPLRTSHGGWGHPKELRPRANLSRDARRLLERLGYSDPDRDADNASLLWDFSLAVMYTPAYGKENQAALRLGWPRLPLPGWGIDNAPLGALRVVEEYAKQGRIIRGILSGAKLPHQDILSEMATVRLDSENESTDPARLNDTQRTLSANWGVPAKRSAVRPQNGALAIKWTGGALLKRILELADAMELPAADCLERLGECCADARINNEASWVDIPGAAWDFTIGGRKVLRKWLSYRDCRVIKRPMLPEEMERFSDIARRLVMLTLIGIKLDRMWGKLLESCNQ